MLVISMFTSNILFAMQETIIKEKPIKSGTMVVTNFKQE